MSFPKVTLSCKDDLGHDCKEPHKIEIECTKVELRPNTPPQYKITATIGDITHEHGLTMGPTGGPFVPITLEQFQRDVDLARKEAAKHAHFRHVVSELESKIK